MIWACFCAELGFSVKLKHRGAASVCTELNANQKKFICNEHSMRSKSLLSTTTTQKIYEDKY